MRINNTYILIVFLHEEGINMQNLEFAVRRLLIDLSLD